MRERREREDRAATYLRDRDKRAVSPPGCAQAGLRGAAGKAEGYRQGGRNGRSIGERPGAHFPVSFP